VLLVAPLLRKPIVGEKRLMEFADFAPVAQILDEFVNA
jgi:hypothetical protein